jgi:hypothetical protein
MLNKHKKGDVVPILDNNHLGYAIIVDTYAQNYHILEHIGINIYKVLFKDRLMFIDDVCIYNGFTNILTESKTDER